MILYTKKKRSFMNRCFMCVFLFLSLIWSFTTDNPGKVLGVGATGGRGKIYSQIIKERPDLLLTGVVSRKDDLSDFKNKFVQTKSFVKYDSLADALSRQEEWDIIFLAGPHKLNDDCLNEIVNKWSELKKKPIIIKEKPILSVGLDKQLSSEVLESIEQLQIPLVVTTERIYDKNVDMFYKNIKDHITYEKIDSIRHDYTISSDSITGWRSKKKEAIGGIIKSIF